MIQVRITSGFYVDKLTAALPLEDIDRVNYYMNIKGKNPGQVLNAMVVLGMDWEIEYEKATENECREWMLADLISRCVRAKKMGKIIIFEGESVSCDDFHQKVIDFISRNQSIPDIIADNSEFYILGIAEQEEGGKTLNMCN